MIEVGVGVAETVRLVAHAGHGSHPLPEKAATAMRSAAIAKLNLRIIQTIPQTRITPDQHLKRKAQVRAGATYRNRRISNNSNLVITRSPGLSSFNTTRHCGYRRSGRPTREAIRSRGVSEQRS